MGWKPEVKVDNKWSQNGFVFATEKEAASSAYALMIRWLGVSDVRAVEVPDAEPNYAFDPVKGEVPL